MTSRRFQKNSYKAWAVLKIQNLLGKDGVFFYQSAILALQTAHFAFQLLHDLGILTNVEIDRHKILLQVNFYFLKMTKE